MQFQSQLYIIEYFINSQIKIYFIDFLDVNLESIIRSIIITQVVPFKILIFRRQTNDQNFNIKVESMISQHHYKIVNILICIE